MGQLSVFKNIRVGIDGYLRFRQPIIDHLLRPKWLYFLNLARLLVLIPSN